MKFAAFCLLACACFAAVSAQGSLYDYTGEFGAPSGFGGPGPFGASLQQQASARDPRANTGPVTFPMSPPASFETSGVVVGASGFGFVPSNRAGQFSRS